MVDRDTDDRRGGWTFRPGTPVTEPLDFSTQVAAASGESPVHLHFVYTDDGLYVPAVVRTPPGEGPFPLVIAMHGGSGGLGASWLVDFVLNRGYALDRFLEAGYAVCWTEGRMEVEEAYGMEPVESTNPPLPAVLDHQDVIATYRYLREQSFVDADRVGFFGVSHGGELQMKILAEIGDGPAAMAPFEPAAIEFLGLQYDGPRTEANLQFNDPLDDDQVLADRARERIAGMADDVPILVGGRDDDHLQGLFHKLYELLDEAGKDVRWQSWDHPEHAYQWGPYRTSTVDEYEGSVPLTTSTYEPDDVTVDTLDTVVEFMNEHVRDA